MRFITSLALAMALVVSSAAVAGPVVSIDPIVLEGDVVTGVGNISSGFGASETHSVNNSGTWVVRADTTHANTDADNVVVTGTGASSFSLLLREDMALASPAGARLDSFDSLPLNNGGNFSCNYFLDGTTGSSDDSGIYYNNDLLFQEGSIATAAGFGPNTPYIGFFETKINNNNLVAVMASIDDPNVASTVDRATTATSCLSPTSTAGQRTTQSRLATTAPASISSCGRAILRRSVGETGAAARRRPSI